MSGSQHALSLLSYLGFKHHWSHLCSVRQGEMKYSYPVCRGVLDKQGQKEAQGREIQLWVPWLGKVGAEETRFGVPE